MGKTIIIEIENPQEDSEAKLEKALQVLSQATGHEIEFEHNHDAEPTPYLALRELADDLHKPVEDGLVRLLAEIIDKWIRRGVEKAESRKFKLNNKVYLNPKTGRYLTMADWKAIQKDLTSIFTWLYGQTDEAMVKKALALGKVLQAMNPMDSVDVSLENVASKLDSVAGAMQNDKLFNHIVDFANVHTGELIQDVTDRSRKAIVKVIMSAYQQRKTQVELEKDLFEEFSTLNRDWRRIAETESSINFNNGYMVGELKEGTDNGEPIFMQGISGGGACSFCATHVNGKVVMLLAEPPADGGDDVEYKGNVYKAIWPGKNNFGRKRNQWWVAPNVHVNCRCSWVRTIAATSDYYTKLRAIMDS